MTRHIFIACSLPLFDPDATEVTVTLVREERGYRYDELVEVVDKILDEHDRLDVRVQKHERFVTKSACDQ